MSKKLTVFFSILLISLAAAGNVFGSGVSISAVSRLDLAKGAVMGENAEFTLYIPQRWQGFLIADREHVKGRSNTLERLDFYYQPYNKVEKPVFAMSLCVYDCVGYVETEPYRKLMETKKYVFAVNSAVENHFEGATDRALFNIFLNNMNDDDYLIELITLPKDDERIAELTITINGRHVTGTVVREHNAVYLPVREVCEALGYNVGWLEKDKAVTISKDKPKEYRLLTVKESSANLGYSVLMNKNRVYVSSIYFVKQLKCNVEVDDRYNVSIYK